MAARTSSRTPRYFPIARTSAGVTCGFEFTAAAPCVPPSGSGAASSAIPNDHTDRLAPPRALFRGGGAGSRFGKPRGKFPNQTGSRSRNFCLTNDRAGPTFRGTSVVSVSLFSFAFNFCMSMSFGAARGGRKGAKASAVHVPLRWRCGGGRRDRGRPPRAFAQLFVTVQLASSGASNEP